MFTPNIESVSGRTVYNRTFSIFDSNAILQSLRQLQESDSKVGNISSSGISFRDNEEPDPLYIAIVPHTTLPPYSVIDLDTGYAFDPIAPVCNAKPNESPAKVIVVTGSETIYPGFESWARLIGTHRPELVRFTGTAPSPGQTVGPVPGDTTVSGSYTGLRVVSEVDITNTYVWVIRDFGTKTGDPPDLYIVEPKEDPVYPGNEGETDGVIGYVHEWSEGTCEYVKNTGTEIRIFDPTKMNFVLPKEKVFARKITQPCEGAPGELQERYEIIGSHGLHRKVTVPKVSSGDQILSVIPCGGNGTVNVHNTITPTVDIPITAYNEHGPQVKLFEKDEPIAFYDSQESKWYFEPYTPPIFATSFTESDVCATSPVELGYNPEYEDRLEIECEGEDTRSNKWTVNNPYGLAWRAYDKVLLFRDRELEEYQVWRAAVHRNEYIADVTYDDVECTLSFERSAIYGYDCAEPISPFQIGFENTNILTAVSHTDCGLVFTTKSACVLNLQALSDTSITGTDVSAITDVGFGIDGYSGLCQLEFTQTTICALGVAAINPVPMTLPFTNQQIVVDVREDVQVSGGVTTTCVIKEVMDAPFPCTPTNATENNIFCYTDCDTATVSASGINDAPLIPHVGRGMYATEDY